MKHSKHGDPELQLLQSSSTSHTDESMVLRMTQVPKHGRFLYSTIVDLCNQTLAGQRPYVEESLGGGEVTVIVGPTTQLWYLPPRGYAYNNNTVLAQSHATVTKMFKLTVIDQTEKRNTLSCPLS